MHSRVEYQGIDQIYCGVLSTAVDMVASGKIDVKSLITHRFKFEEAEQAFELVKKGQEDVLKVVIEGVL